MKLGRHLYLLAAMTSFTTDRMSTVQGIVSPAQVEGSEKLEAQQRENQGSHSQTIKRDYSGGFDDNYDHSGGLSAHVSNGYNSQEYDGHDIFDDVNHHYQEPHLHHHHLHHIHKYHKHDDSAYQKALAIKGLLVPLAGVALLGAAAAFVSNPILLQLGVVSGAALGRRKRGVEWSSKKEAEAATQNEIRLEELKLLERFMAQVPKREIETQEKRMMATLVSCPGLSNDYFCLERLACELHSAEAFSMPTEANVLSVILNAILVNGFVATENKTKLLQAIERGKNNSGCEVYRCSTLQQNHM